MNGLTHETITVLALSGIAFLIFLTFLIIILRQQHTIREKNSSILDLTKENSRLSVIQENFENYKKDIASIEENSKNAFTSAAKDLFYTTGNRLTEINRQSVEDLLKPFKEQIIQLRQQVEDAKIKGAENKTSLEENIRNLLEQTQKISNDANKLTTALKGDKKMQGNWGEAILATILQSSGLQEGVHYYSQKEYKDENGDSFRPDVVVRLPQENSYIIIDSKVSLNAYTDYCNEDDETARMGYLAKHVEALKKHVIELSDKKYSTIVNGAIGFVLMFVPNESSYIVALGKDPGLQQFAQKRKVIIVSPANLMTALQLTLLLWNSELQRQNINKIIDLGNKIYDKFVTFTNGFTQIGDKLGKALEEYNESYSRLTAGSDNLIGKMEKFRKMGLEPSKRLNEKLLANVENLEEGSVSEDALQESDL